MNVASLKFVASVLRTPGFLSMHSLQHKTLPLSANGTVRPCSRPASNRSWEGRQEGARHVPDNMAQLLGIKTPVAAFMADSPILLA